MKPIQISDATFDTEVLKSDTLTIVDFWAPWCGPCRIVGPILEDIAQQFDGQIKVTKLNVDEYPAAAESFGIHGIPTLLFFRDGQIVDTLVGAVPRSQLAATINRLLQKTMKEVR